MLTVIKENFKDEKDIKENYEDNNSVESVIWSIVGVVAFVLSMYIWIGFHYNNNSSESSIYKVLTFIVAFFSNMLYVLFNLATDTKNTIEIVKQIPKFPPVLK